MRTPAAEPAPIPAIPAVDNPVPDVDAVLEDVAAGRGAADVARLRGAVVCCKRTKVSFIQVQQFMAAFLRPLASSFRRSKPHRHT